MSEQYPNKPEFLEEDIPFHEIDGIPCSEIAYDGERYNVFNTNNLWGYVRGLLDADLGSGERTLSSNVAIDLGLQQYLEKVKSNYPKLYNHVENLALEEAKARHELYSGGNREGAQEYYNNFVEEHHRSGEITLVNSILLSAIAEFEKDSTKLQQLTV